LFHLYPRITLPPPSSTKKMMMPTSDLFGRFNNYHVEYTTGILFPMTKFGKTWMQIPRSVSRRWSIPIITFWVKCFLGFIIAWLSWILRIDCGVVLIGGVSEFDGIVLAVSRCQVGDVIESLVSSVSPLLRLYFSPCLTPATSDIKIERLKLYRLNVS
jgi:hypothetical protein